MSGAKIYFTIPILGGINISQTAVSSFVVMLFLCIGGIVLGRGLQKRPGGRQVLVEKLVGMLYGLVEETMGKHNSHWACYIGALFLSSMCGSMIGMTGIFRSTTCDLSTTIVWALMTTGLVWYWSIRTNGFLGWLKGFTEPIVIMLPMNIISEIAQPISMAFRHFGNIMGGGVLISLLYTALATASSVVLGLVGSNLIVSIAVLAVGVLLLVLQGIRKKKLMGKIVGILFTATGVLAILESLSILTGVPYLMVGLPGLLSLYFDVFSSLVQALVFSLLTMVYVSAALPEPEEDETALPQ